MFKAAALPLGLRLQQIKLGGSGVSRKPTRSFPATGDFRDHSLPFRVTLPLRWNRKCSVPVSQGYGPWTTWTRGLLVVAGNIFRKFCGLACFSPSRWHMFHPLGALPRLHIGSFSLCKVMWTVKLMLVRDEWVEHPYLPCRGRTLAVEIIPNVKFGWSRWIWTIECMCIRHVR